MNWLRLTILALACACLMGCSSGSGSLTAPSPSDPFPPDNGGELPDDPNNQNPNIPAVFSRSVILTNWSTSVGIHDLFGVPYFPGSTTSKPYPTLETDPKLTLDTTPTSGLLYIGIVTNSGSGNPENGGFTYFTVPTFYSSITSNKFTMIFSDDYGVLRVEATRSGNQITGSLYNRNRAANDTQCMKEITTVCNPVWNGTTWVFTDCHDYDSTNYQACVDYTNPSNSLNVRVGNFTKSNFWEWVH